MLYSLITDRLRFLVTDKMQSVDHEHYILILCTLVNIVFEL